MVTIAQLKEYPHTPLRAHKHHFNLTQEICCRRVGENPPKKYIITGFTDEYAEENPSRCSLVEKETRIISGGVKFEGVEIVPC